MEVSAQALYAERPEKGASKLPRVTNNEQETVSKVMLLNVT